MEEYCEAEHYAYEIDQPLYSRMTVVPNSNYDTTFFSTHIGMFNKEGLMIERTETNMDNPSMCVNIFRIEGIRFKETEIDSKVRMHLMKYAYFILRILDRDYLVYPVHLMDNYYFFLEKKISIPLVLAPYENFSVILKMKPYEYAFQLTCELLGKIRRQG